MTSKQSTQSAHANPGDRLLPLLLILFVGSGSAALIYEIVWFQLLAFVVGSSAVSLGLLLGAYMGGMCLGSLGLARVVSARRHPLRVYALLELGIGLIGLAEPVLMPLVHRLYAPHVGHGTGGLLLRGAVSAICLLPPTLLMGATLPAISRWVRATPRGVAWLGFFYGGNIAGAVLGCLLAGFYLLRVHDMATATNVAAAINFAVAALAFLLAPFMPYDPTTEENSVEDDAISEAASGRRLLPLPTDWPVYLAIAVSGATALAAEVIWTRLLSLMMGGTVYTFSIILAVFLAGLGIGSGVGAMLARLTEHPRRSLGICQALLAAAIAWTAWTVNVSMPWWPIDPTLTTRSPLGPWIAFQLDLARCAWATLPATVLWGASFPLALAAVAGPRKDPGRLVGGVYAANTIGAIVGAAGCSVVLVAWLGTQHVQRLAILLSTAAAILMLAPRCPRDRPATTLPPATRAASLWSWASVPLLALFGILLAAGVRPIPGNLVAYGRFLPMWETPGAILYVGEGMNASVAVTENYMGYINFHVSGKVEASSEPADMRLQRMLGHIPALIHGDPRSVLVVGCGAGVTAGSFIPHPGIERIVICEIEPLIPRVVAQYFDEENYGVASGHDLVEIVYDDARHYVRSNDEKFDIVTSDPMHPWIKGSASLYTKEYFEMVKRHLNPGGMVTQWVPLYESDVETVKSEIATFFEVFPYGVIWSNDIDGEGYDLVLLGAVEPLRIDVAALERRLNEDAMIDVKVSLDEVGFANVVQLLATYAGTAADLHPWMKDAQLNLDSNLRLQYLAGMGLNMEHAGPIFDEIEQYAAYPADILTISDARLQAFKRELGFND
jgi:spermidine synthase